MKLKINYEGTEIWVEEKVKTCLDELKREEESRQRKHRRKEILWDSILVEGMKQAKKLGKKNYSLEDKVIKEIYLQELYLVLMDLEELDRKLIVDRFINELKFRELSVKYSIPITSIQYKLERILKYINNALNNI